MTVVGSAGTLATGDYGVWAHLDVTGAAQPVAVVVTGIRGTWYLVAERNGATHRVKRHNVETPESARRWMATAAQAAAEWRAEATGGPVWPGEVAAAQFAAAQVARDAAREAARANAVLYRNTRPFSIWKADD